MKKNNLTLLPTSPKQTVKTDETYSRFLKGLELRPQIGGIVEGFAFSDDTRQTLAKWLEPTAIDRLQGLTEVARKIETDKRDEPSFNENREVLTRISELSMALATAISNAPSVAEAELTLIGHHAFGDMFALKKLASDLQTVADKTIERAALLPAQSTRHSPVFFVSCIADIAQAQGIKVSEAANSKFLNICTCTFKAAGIFSDPRGAIRAYLKRS